MNKTNKKPEPMQKFKELGLSEKTLQALHKKGFEEPTEIQSKVIPHLLEDERDVIGQAQTGTGKTAAFALPLIEKLDASAKYVQAIVLAPTRELAIQVCEEINSLKGENSISASPIYGGQSIELQLRRLKKGVSIIVGTPGRIQDHIKRKSLKLDRISYFILDEADEMLNMGFIEDIEAILDVTPAEKKVLLFSATMPKRIKLLASKYMRAKAVHIKTKTELTTNLTDQIYFEVARRDKFEALSRIIDLEDEFYGLVFCRTKIDVDELSAKLIDRGYNAEGLHGDISQAQRERILEKFRKRRVTILAATDVAARGIDVMNLSHVINYSIPQNPEAYIHRIGRTGRAGKKGTAITFVTSDEFRKLGFIKKITEADIKKKDVPDVNEIINIRKKRINDLILADAETGVEKDYYKWVDQLIQSHDIKDVMAAVLKNAYYTVVDKRSYAKLAGGSKKKKNRESVLESKGKTRLFIAKGKKDRLNKRELVAFIKDTAGTPSSIIDSVELYQDFSFITVPFKEAENILNKFKEKDKGKRSLVAKAKVTKQKGSQEDRKESGSDRQKRAKKTSEKSRYGKKFSRKKSSAKSKSDKSFKTRKKVKQK